MLIRLNGARGHGGRRGDSEWVVGLSHHSSSSASSFYSPSSSWRGEETSSEWMMVLSWSDGSPWEPHDGRPFHLPPVPHEYSTETWVSHIQTCIAYTQQEKTKQQEPVIFLLLGGTSPILRTFRRELFKKALCKYFEPFFEKSLRSHLHGQSTEGKWGYPNCGKIPERRIGQLP